MIDEIIVLIRENDISLPTDSHCYCVLLLGFTPRKCAQLPNGHLVFGFANGEVKSIKTKKYGKCVLSDIIHEKC